MNLEKRKATVKGVAGCCRVLYSVPLADPLQVPSQLITDMIPIAAWIPLQSAMWHLVHCMA